MNKIIIPLLSFLFAMCDGTPAQLPSPANAPKGKVVKYEYRKSGTMIQPIHEFEVEKIDDSTCRLAFYNHNKDLNAEPYEDEDGNLILDRSTQPIALLDTIQQVFVDHKMWKYKGSYYPPFQVLDGYSWSLHITLDDGTTYSSHGSNACPDDDGMHIIVDMLRRKFDGL